jgi:hypothetical protein
MSNAEEAEADENNNVCANCGVAEVDDIKLEDCDGCNLVKCCSDKCTENHREQHEEECKKRAQQLHDDKLFRQQERSHRWECPLCFLPLPLGVGGWKCIFWPCCTLGFVMAVNMFISISMEAIGAHSVESRW